VTAGQEDEEHAGGGRPAGERERERERERDEIWGFQCWREIWGFQLLGGNLGTYCVWGKFQLVLVFSFFNKKKKKKKKKIEK